MRKMFPCPFCLLQYEVLQYLMNHIKLKHRCSMYTECLCRYSNCFGKFNSVYAYKKHLNVKHSPNNGNITCLSIELEVSTAAVSDQDSCTTNTANPIPETKIINNFDASKAKEIYVKPKITSKEFESKLFEKVAGLLTKLYNIKSLPRSSIHIILKEINNFYNVDCIETIKQHFSNHDCKYFHELMTLLSTIQTCFSSFKTEHLTLKIFEEFNCFIRPQTINIDVFLNSRHVKGEQEIVTQYRKISFISIKSVLKYFLELPGVFDTVIKTLKSSNSETVINTIVEGETWKLIKNKMVGKLTLPIILYCDDFEINNPLGSHKGIQKICAVYYSIACLPEQHSSMLENIFLAQLHYTKDHKIVGNKIIFSHLIDEIKDLEDKGIVLSVFGRKVRVYFALAFIIGDNLSVHTILGLVKSFNGSHSCRICTVNKQTSQNLLLEDTNEVRTIDSYNLNVRNHSEGVIENCVFNTIESFHLTENIAVDVMHDIFEGICRYEIGDILNNLIYKQELFPLEVLNARIQYMSHVPGSGENVIPLFTENNIKNKNQLNIYASEMYFLVKNLGFLIGDLVHTNNKVWSLYIALREMICVIMAPVFNLQTPIFLETLIAKHHSLYIEIFNETLKPKHHLLLHYPRVMKKTGPLKNISCMRFEAKHRQLINEAKATTSRVNSPCTLALKHQLQMSYRIFSQTGFSKRLSFGSILNEELSDLTDYFLFKNIISCNKDIIHKSVSWVRIHGTYYCKDLIIIVDTDGLFPNYGKIVYVLVDSKDEVSFIYLKMQTLRFDDHVHGYEVKVSKTWGYICQSNLADFYPYNIFSMSNRKKYVPCI